MFQLFEELINQLSQNAPVLDLSVLLVGTAAFERSLGDVSNMEASEGRFIFQHNMTAAETGHGYAV